MKQVGYLPAVVRLFPGPVSRMANGFGGCGPLETGVSYQGQGNFSGKIQKGRGYGILVLKLWEP